MCQNYLLILYKYKGVDSVFPFVVKSRRELICLESWWRIVVTCTQNSSYLLLVLVLLIYHFYYDSLSCLVSEVLEKVGDLSVCHTVMSFRNV